MHTLRMEGTHLACTSAIPMWKRRQSGLSSPGCRQVSSEDDGASCSLVRIWKPGDTRLAATSHFSGLSPVSPAVVSPPGATNYVIEGTQGGVLSHRSVHTSWSADPYGSSTYPN